MNTLITLWIDSFRRPRFALAWAGTLAVLYLLGRVARTCFAYVQARPGCPLRDSLLEWLPVYELSAPTFVLTYGAIALAVGGLARSPGELLKSLQAYCLLVLLRLASIFLTPLEPPAGIIPLTDPIVNDYLLRNAAITKDLFFSGHVSILFLLVLVAQNTLKKTVLLAVTGTVALFLLLQRVHYTIDVLAAPLFAFVSYHLVFKETENGSLKSKNA